MTTLIHKKTVYISLPISGLPDRQTRARAEELKRRYLVRGFNVITPFDIVPDSNLTYGHCMGKDIEAILDRADIVFFASGWWKSRGCRLEFCTALIYHKKKKFE